MFTAKATVISVSLMGCIASATAAGGQKNTTGLPTYPHDAGGIMDATYRSIPNGQHCINYQTSSKDSLATVEDWYKKELPNAKIDDINHNSWYGSNFKLNGIKLQLGNDVVNIYADTDRNMTTIELFKCQDAAKPSN